MPRLSMLQFERRRRPCPDCTRPCACSGSTRCGCRCSWVCEHAPDMLLGSTRPRVHPDLLPLAFEVANHAMFELLGTRAATSELLPPALSFRARGRYPIHLLRQLLENLVAQGVLHSQWSLTEAQPDVFALHPNMDFCHDPAQLRRDIRAIANHLHHGLYSCSVAELKSQLSPAQAI